MAKAGQRKCMSCGEFFDSDHRNRNRQIFCSAAACRRASKAASQARWVNDPDNAGYFKDPGATVIAGVGSDDKFEIVRRYGASEVINYRTEVVRERIKAITGGRGVDVCFEMIGGDIFDQMTRLMAWKGRLMPIGFVSGKIPSVPMNLPLLKNYSIVGVFYGAAMRNEPEATALMYDELMRLAANGTIKPFVQTVMRLDQAVEAMQMVADRKVQGRVVLKVR